MDIIYYVYKMPLKYIFFKILFMSDVHIYIVEQLQSEFHLGRDYTDTLSISRE